MSLEQTLASGPSRRPHHSLLSASLAGAMLLALAGCDKPATSASEEVKAPVVLPTGTMGDTIPTGSTKDAREATLGEIIRLVLAHQDTVTFPRVFPQDPENPDNWRLAALTLGFGPQGKGTHMVTVKKQGDTASVYEILDADSDGNPDRVEFSTSSPSFAADGTPMSHSDKSYVIDDATNDMYAAGLKKAEEFYRAQVQSSQ